MSDSLDTADRGSKGLATKFVPIVSQVIVAQYHEATLCFLLSGQSLLNACEPLIASGKAGGEQACHWGESKMKVEAVLELILSSS